jgi:TrmH family RNA methyltransferase
MEFPVTITSSSNSRVKALRAAASGEASQPGELLAIEGENLISEAIRSHVRFDTVYVREGNEAILQRPALHGLEARYWAVLSPGIFAIDTPSPQGIAATIGIPVISAANLEERTGVVLVVEALQDPGNLGTLIRSAEAFGVKQIFVTHKTVNCWNPKAVRASAGSVFRVPVTRAPLESIKELLAPLGYRFFAAVAGSQGATSVADAELQMPCVLMIGNEGAGLSAAALELADGQVNIPCAVESLNAAIAGSTLMYEAMRQNLARRAEGTA